MSATILTQKFDVTSESTLYMAIADWLVEKAGMVKKYNLTAGTAPYIYLSWAGESIGLQVGQDHRSSYTTLSLKMAYNITASGGSAYNGLSVKYVISADQATGTKHYSCGVTLVKTEKLTLFFLTDGSDVSVAKGCVVLGKASSVLIGERLFVTVPSIPSSASSSNLFIVEGGTGLTLASFNTIICSASGTDPQGELLLSPAYALLSGVRMDPMLLPGLYAESGSSYPDMLTQFTAGTKAMLQVDTKIALDIT